MSAERFVVPDWKRPALLGYVVIFVCFGGIGGWAALARLDSAVVANGVVTVESNRKTIQHFEGGMVREIHVREGQHVAAGELLFRLDNTQSQANVDMARNQLAGNLAQEARAIAERDGAEDIKFPDELTANSDSAVVKDVMADQRKQFVERRASLKSQLSILDNKILTYETEIEGLAGEKAATQRQLAWIEQELGDLRGLLDKGLVPKTRVLVLEREKSRLEGVIGRSTADASKAQNGIAEAKMQIDGTQKKYLEDVNTTLVDVRQKIADLREKVTVSQDVLRRIEIRAPQAGVVQNVRVATVGGVVRASDPLLELIPDGDGLMVNAQVSPTDIDAVRADMLAEVRFSAFHGKLLPIVSGRVASVSRDRLMDDATKSTYFLARVVVDDAELPPEIHGRLTAGMPVDVIIPTGERTVVDYLVRPLMNRARKSLRER